MTRMLSQLNITNRNKYMIQNKWVGESQEIWEQNYKSMILAKKTRLSLLMNIMITLGLLQVFMGWKTICNYWW